MKDIKTKKDFKKEAQKVLKSKNKIKIPRPNKKKEKKEFIRQWEIFHKEYPKKSKWEFARLYMNKRLGF